MSGLSCRALMPNVGKCRTSARHLARNSRRFSVLHLAPCLLPSRHEASNVTRRIDDATAGGMPVAYLTAQIVLTQAGFERGKTVLAPAIGAAVGNAVTQLARAQGAAKAMSTTTNPA